MSDLLRRLVGRALGQGALVQPVVGSRFGREPELLSERGLDEDQPAAAPALAGGEARRALPAAPDRKPDRKDDEEQPAQTLQAQTLQAQTLQAQTLPTETLPAEDLPAETHPAGERIA